MVKRLSILIGCLLLILLLASAASAQGYSPEHSDPNWQAFYWNNMTLSGAPVLSRQEQSIDYDWGTGSPQPGLVNNDQFSARWSRYIDVLPGTYRFSATSDDGIRVFVDGHLIIDDWNDHPVRTVTADRYLGPGHHLIVVEYYENGGQAVAKVSWASVNVITKWRGEYFNNISLSGAPALVRDDAHIFFDWGFGSPAPGPVNPDLFSVRWTRTIQLPAGQYIFYTTVDDGVRLWVGGHLLIDYWQVQSARTYSGSIYLPGGATEIRMEYFENTQRAVAQLTWSTGGVVPPPLPPTPPGPPPPPPTSSVIVDDASPGFIKGGAPASWRVVPEGYNGQMLWTKNNYWARPYYNWAQWHPTLTPGRYEVFVHIPINYSTTTSARYWVSHRDGYSLQVVDQSAYGGTWVSLGTYWFRGIGADYVSLADVTDEPYLTSKIAFDAVRWDPR
jgi:hypothetical protein